MTPLETPESQAVDPNCIFCKIISGEVPSRRIYEDDRALAFLDIGAWHRGHALVVPKRHVPDLITGPASLSEIAPAIDAVARLLMDRLAADGINLLSSTGEAAGQEVFHLHVHVVPRWNGDTNFMTVVGQTRVLPQELPVTADRLRPIFERLTASQ